MECRLELIGHIYPDPEASGSRWRKPFLWHAGRWVVTLRKDPRSRARCRSIDGTRKCLGGLRWWQVRQKIRLLRCRAVASDSRRSHWFEK
jgi:hypothetical protein